ncbi:CBS domain-containing protein [Ktedonobacteria bacterium brp13]|nr:CBS domain-containing protein [Ktedonobacteria bacterium brp13]
MIVRDIMTTRLIAVEPDDTLAHAITLLRQYHFHHLPVTCKLHRKTPEGVLTTLLLCEGMVSTQDIDIAAAGAPGRQNEQAFWQERRIVEVMHHASLRVTPTTSVSAAAQILVERGLNCLPVVEYELIEGETQAVLVGLITRSDLLQALSRAMGSAEPGMQLDVLLPLGDISSLANTLLLAHEMHVQVHSVLATPDEQGNLKVASLRLGTINPSPLLVRLRKEGIQYSYGESLKEDEMPQR